MFNAQARRDYDRSNAVTNVKIGIGREIVVAAGRVRRALSVKDPSLVMAAATALVDALCGAAKIPPIPVEIVLQRNRSGRAGCRDRRDTSYIALTLRMTQRGRFVGFRTLLKALCHAFCHHHDWSALGLTHSLHTKGFGKRLDVLYKSIVGGLAALDKGAGP